MRSTASILALTASVIGTALCLPFSSAEHDPIVIEPTSQVSFVGNISKGIESFLNIRFGEDTSGGNRFAHPIPFSYPQGSTVNATAPGAACPQQHVPVPGIPVFANVTDTSEDCLTLRVDRPMNTTSGDKLPVMVYIYGGGDSIGQIYDSAYNPTGLVLQSVKQGTPVMYVAMNYRVGIFGFAATSALEETNSLNSGLYDQRLALDWVQKHIEAFGGDPNEVTIFGESDGATAVGLHITAFGGDVQPPFKRAIMQSGAPTADAGVSDHSTLAHTNRLIAELNCTSSDSAQELECLRKLPVEDLLHVAVAYQQANAPLGFDVFIPTAPSTFIPDAPSRLLRTGRFAHNIPLITGWNEDDGSLFAPTNLTTDKETEEWARHRFAGIDVDQLLDLYPSKDFASADGVSEQFYRISRMSRDAKFSCPSLLVVEAMANRSAPETAAYLYSLNQTLFTRFFARENATYFGASHFSDIPFVFNYASAPAFNASDELLELSSNMSRAWIDFANGPVSRPERWLPAVSGDDTESRNIRIWGGPNNGPAIVDSGRGDDVALYDEDLLARCAFWNSAEVMAQLGT